MAQLFILDRYENPVAVLSTEAPEACPFFDDTHTERLEDGFATYKFSVPLNHEDAAKIQARGYVVLRDLDGVFQLFRIETIDDITEESGERIRQVYAETAATELNNDIVRPMTFVGTAEEALDFVLAGTRWQRGIVQWTGSVTLDLRDYPTVLAAVRKILEAFGGELRFRVTFEAGRVTGRYVDLLAWRGRFTGKRFEYAKDMEGVTRTEDVTKLATALIGLGKSDDSGNRVTFSGVTWSKANGDPADKPAGQDWVGDEDALQVWGVNGKHLFDVFEDNEETNPARLLQKTWDELQNRINGRFTYEVNVAVLERMAGFEHEEVRLGDTVTVHDYVHDQPLILEARVIQVERSYSDPSRDKVTLGRYRPILFSLPEVVADIQETIRRKQAQWEAGGETIFKSSVPPENPAIGQLWLDTSTVPNVLKRWDGSAWVKVTPTEPDEVGAEKEIIKSPTPPGNPQPGALWLNTSVIPNVLMYWDGTQWIKCSPTEAGEIGAETPEGAWQKAQEALEEAQRQIEQARQELQQAIANLETTTVTLEEAEQLIQDTISNPQNYSGDFVGDIIADSLIVRGPITAQNATITGTITASNATFLNITVQNANIINSSIQNCTITGTLNGVNGTFTGSLVGVTGTFLGSLQTTQNAYVGGSLYLGYGNPSSMTLWFGYDTPNAPSIYRYLGQTNVYFDLRSSGRLELFGRLRVQYDVQASDVWANYVVGYSNTNIIYFSYSGPHVDMTGGTARWKQSSGNYIRQATDGTVTIFVNDAARHIFNPNGTKTGGSIEIDGKVWGMSPIDSPRVLIEDILFDVAVDGQKIVYFDKKLSKAIGKYAVFPSNPDVRVLEKRDGSFVLEGHGVTDLRIVGLRIGHEDVYWVDMEKESEEA